MTSPASRCTGGSPTIPPQHSPEVTTWYSMTCSAPGSTSGRIARAGSVSAAHGALPSILKKIAPVSRTVRSTSETVSVLVTALPPDAR